MTIEQYYKEISTLTPPDSMMWHEMKDFFSKAKADYKKKLSPTDLEKVEKQERNFTNKMQSSISNIIENEQYQRLSIRDYSLSQRDKYAQLLQTIHFHLTANNQQKEFFNLLEHAETEGKYITVLDDADEYTIESLQLSSEMKF